MKFLLNKTKILRKLYPKQLIWDFPDESRKIYLTFDDGPTPGVTDKLLNILQSYNAKATFFCIGKNVLANQKLFQQILDEGHSIGNHTWDHANGKNSTTEQYLSSINKAHKIIQSNLFRPPYGRINSEQAKLVGEQYKIIMWSVLSRDFEVNLVKEKCLNVVTKNTEPGSIVVFHDSTKAAEKMLYVVPKVLEYYMQKGFDFSAIE